MKKIKEQELTEMRNQEEQRLLDEVHNLKLALQHETQLKVEIYEKNLNLINRILTLLETSEQEARINKYTMPNVTWSHCENGYCQTGVGRP